MIATTLDRAQCQFCKKVVLLVASVHKNKGGMAENTICPGCLGLCISALIANGLSLNLSVGLESSLSFSHPGEDADLSQYTKEFVRVEDCQ